MTKKKDRAFSTGLMVENMKVVGITVNNTVSEFTPQLVVKLNKESGKKERGCTGFSKMINETNII
jgi:hypothetical protein